MGYEASDGSGTQGFVDTPKGGVTPALLRAAKSQALATHANLAARQSACLCSRYAASAHARRTLPTPPLTCQISPRMLQ